MEMIEKQAVIDWLALGVEILNRVLNDMDVVGQDREKYLWGRELIESVISDIKELPSVQPEIIRCKDCKYSKSFDDGGIWCDRLTGTFKVESGGYCKWGKGLISRRDAIDALREAENHAFNGLYKGLVKAHKIVADSPSAQPEQRWIPCSERLPEEDVEVLISYRYKEGEGDTSHTNIDITTYGQMYFGGIKIGDHKHWRAPFEYFESNYEVVAWMPLPKPWKGAEG